MRVCAARGKWLDFVHRHATSGTTVAFSWKPEFYTVTDAIAFRVRFCASPPDLLYVGKGLHDACRRNTGSLAAHTAHAETQLRKLGGLMSCLPPTSLIVVRTPYAADGERSLSGAQCDNATAEAQLVASTARVMRRLHAEGALGNHSLLLDAHRFTTAAEAYAAELSDSEPGRASDGTPPGSESDAAADAGARVAARTALRSPDGHHFGPAVQGLERALLLHAWERWAQGQGRRGEGSQA